MYTTSDDSDALWYIVKGFTNKHAEVTHICKIPVEILSCHLETFLWLTKSCLEIVLCIGNLCLYTFCTMTLENTFWLVGGMDEKLQHSLMYCWNCALFGFWQNFVWTEG